MLKLILVGLLSGMFFSSTFILNRYMSLEGGHWVWSASLRYAYMLLFLVVLQLCTQGMTVPGRLLGLFFRHWRFWITAGSIGFGGFYSLICFSADHAPGWVVATTWQLTIIASLVVLIGFERRFPKRIWGFSAIVFAGVLTVNLTNAESAQIKDLLLGSIPVIVAAFCYPFGNQMVWEAQNGNRRLPEISDPLLNNSFNRVFLLSMGSVPFWIVLVAMISPPPPSGGQFINTALVALFSGILATTLFLFARARAQRASELAAVDATQSSEVMFAMIGEIALLSAPLPSMVSVAGIVLVLAGLALFVRFQEVAE